MKKYQRLAQQIISQIELGVWLPGDKLPSLREQVASSGMSFKPTVMVKNHFSASDSPNFAPIP